MELKFKQLVEAYTANLQDTLRNFSVGPDFLDTWVHDEDLSKSIFGIFDAAEVANLTEPLTVVLEKSTAAQVDSKWLLTALSEIGEVTVSEGPDAVRYQVRFAPKSGERKATAAQAVPAPVNRKTEERQTANAIHCRVKFQTAIGELETHPIYRQAITEAAKKLTHEGNLKGYLAESEGVQLHLNLDTHGIVQHARHCAATGVLRVLLDRFCAMITGIPIQEAAEHGAIRTEFQLRDPEADRPVEGIVQTGNVEPRFLVLEKLSRQILEKWLHDKGRQLERNFWTDPVPVSWYQQSREERIAKIQSLLDRACKDLGIQPLQVHDLKNEVRAVIEDEQLPGYPPFHLSLLKLESILKHELGFSVELLLEDRADKNKRHKSREQGTELPLN